MVTIFRDTPCLSITSVAHYRLPVFRTDALMKIVCAALDEARHSGGVRAYSAFSSLASSVMFPPPLTEIVRCQALKPNFSTEIL